MSWTTLTSKKVMENMATFLMSDSKNWNPISLKIHLEGRLVIMELDTGPAVSVMSEGVYQKYLRHVPLKDTP